ncbi:MAG: Type 1 glutamine amidotransferase-like domain-containing protein [bacterium]
MKLVLYSDERSIPNKEADLKTLELTEKQFPDIKFGYIPSSSDKNRKYFNETVSFWSQYGVTNYIYADIEDEYENIDLEELKKCDVIYLSGGNTFQFITNIRKRKFDNFLKEFALNGGVLIGVSAGAIILTPTLESTYEYHKDFGDLNILLPSDFKEVTGLGLVDFEFIPHFEDKSDFITKYTKNKGEYNIMCANGGSAVIVNGDIVSLYGKVINIQNT